MAGTLKVDEFVTHNVGLDEINKAFKLMHDGERSVQNTQQGNNIYFFILSFFLNIQLCTLWAAC